MQSTRFLKFIDYSPDSVTFNEICTILDKNRSARLSLCSYMDWATFLSSYDKYRNCFIKFKKLSVIMSHNLLWRRIVWLTVGVYSSNHRVSYTVEVSMARFQKSVGLSVRPSVCSFVTLTKKTTPPSLLTVGK